MTGRLALALAAGVAAIAVIAVVVLTGSSPDDGAEADIRREAPPETIEAPPPVPPPSGDAVAGRGVFAQAGCGNCHTLAAAASTGTIGPVLDERSPTYERVLDQVTDGGGGMPSYQGTLLDSEIQDVVAFTLEAIESGRGER